ncbi:MAG: cysteine desulfurase [Planctomycetes bacterium]|nr:cysteine desulfurase [Planctomycetota bacterium]
MRLIYLDNAASTPVDPTVREAMLPFIEEQFANPSTRYASGVRAAEALDKARRQIQQALDARDDRVIFTGGGTETNNLAILGAARSRGAGQVLIGSTEHTSVRRPAEALIREGFRVESLPLTDKGAIDMDAALAMVGTETRVIAHMLVNNEVGALYRIAEFFRAAKAKAPHAHLHVDCIQGLGKIDISLDTLNADSMAISGHKIHGPKGVGALILRKDARLLPIIFGGSHEGGLRAGTENVAFIAGLAQAVRMAVQSRTSFLKSARQCQDLLLAGLQELDGVLAMTSEQAVDSIVTVRVPGAPGEVWQHHLEAYGLEVGVGSACQSKSGEISPALKALGLTDSEARQVLRVSFSRMTTPEDVQALVDGLKTLHPKLSQTSTQTPSAS